MIQELHQTVNERIKLEKNLHFAVTLINKYQIQNAALQQQLNDTAADSQEVNWT